MIELPYPNLASIEAEGYQDDWNAIIDTQDPGNTIGAIAFPVEVFQVILLPDSLVGEFGAANQQKKLGMLDICQDVLANPEPGNTFEAQYIAKYNEIYP